MSEIISWGLLFAFMLVIGNIDWLWSITPYEYNEALAKCATHDGLKKITNIDSISDIRASSMSVTCNDESRIKWAFSKEKTQ